MQEVRNAAQKSVLQNVSGKIDKLLNNVTIHYAILKDRDWQN